MQRTQAVRFLPLFLLVCGLLQPTASRALDFHVNQAIGSDAATALQAQNPAEPWATIRHALRSVPDIGGPHTIHVAPGTYNESLESAYPGITLQGSPGTVLQAPPDKTILYIEHADFTLDGVELRGGLHGVRADQADRLTIRNCVVRDATKNGIHATRSESVLVENSEILGNGSRGVLIETAPNAYVRNNLAAFNREWGIEIDGGDHETHAPSTGHILSFNTVTENGHVPTNGGLRFENATGEMRYNIVGANAGRAIKVDTQPTWIHHNLVWDQSLVVDFESDQPPVVWSMIEADPLFIGNGDYRVLPESPAIDAGDLDVSSSDIGGSIQGNLTPDTGLADLGRHVEAAASTGVPPPAQTPAPTPTPAPPSDIEYFVNCSNGDDNRSASAARNPATPWRSIRRGILGAGARNIVTIQDGTCTPEDEIEIDREAVTVRAENLGGVTVVGASGTNAFLIQSDDVTLEGLQIRSSQRGILVATSSGEKISGVTLRNLRIEAPAGELLRLDAITIREGTDILVENNRILGAGGRGVQLRFTDHSIVRNNLITGGSLHEDASWAIDFENDPNTTSVLPPLSTGNLVIFNTVVGNRQGIRFNNAQGQIHDNIVTDQTVSGIRITSPGAASLMHHNNSWNNGQNGDNNYSMPSGYSLWASNISVDPLFTNAAGGTFHLQQIDAGDLADSPLLDLGSAPIGIAEVIGSTRTDGAADTGIADPGFHDNGGRLGTDVSIVPEPDPTQIYVDCANGDDSRSPWEANRPWDGWATIAKAMTEAVTGDTVSLVGGSCQEAVEIETAGVTLRSETPGAGLIEPPTGRTGIRVEADDVHVIGVTIRSDKEGIRIASENSERSLHRVHLESVLVEAPLGTSRFSGEAILMRDAFDSIIEGSIVRQAGGDGIAVNAGEVAEAIGGGSNWIHNNLVTDCDDWGIRVYVRSEVLGMITEANLLSSNTVHGNGSGGIALGSATGEMRHNIVTANSGFGIKTDTAPLLLHHNLVFGNANGYDTESDAEPLGWANLSQDPLFKDSAAGDFRLQQVAAGDPTQSPAVDAGSGSVAENFLSGTTRADGEADQALADLGYHAQAHGNLTKANPGSAPENLTRTFYVDAGTGDNTRHGLEAMDAASPWKTISYALRSKGAQAGDIVAVRAGTYNESVETSVDGVTIQAEPGVTIDAGGDNGFFIEHADITLEGFRIENARHGIRANQAHRLKVRANEVPAPSSTGIKITRTDDAIVDSNLIDGAVSRGIHGTDSPNFYVRNNLVTNTGDWSIEADTAQEEDVVAGTTIAFNTVVGFGTGGIRLDNATGRIRDNIVSGTGNVGIKTDTAPVDVHHNNVLGPNSLFDESSGEEPRRWSNRSETPGFVDQTSGDYRLMSLAAGDPGDSPLLERGSAPAESPEADISGSTTRDGAADTAMADLGYHEMASASPQRPTATVDFQARAGTGTVFHVAPDGDNSTATGSAIDPSTPWQTLRYAARQLAPGDTLQIAAGDYAENISLQSAGIRLRGDPTPGATRILPPSGVLGISIEGHDNVEIEDLTIQGGAQSIKAVGTSGLRLLRVASVSPETTGLKAEDSSDVWIDSSVVTDGGETGILLLRTDRIFLRNNRIYTNGGWAVSIDNETGSEEKPPLATSAGNLIAFNTIHANNDGIRVGAASAEIRDNIITNHQGLGLYLKGNGIFAHHNVFAFNQRNHDRENDAENIFFWDYIGKSPKYVDPAGPDGLLGGAEWLDDNFALATIRTGQSRNSPIIDQGSMETVVAGIDGSTSTDLLADTGIADPGFHANATPASSVPAETDVDPASLRSTFFVSSQFGSDGTEDDPRTSATARDPATPWATLHYAVSRATEGDTIILLPGVYRNSIQIERDGITVKAESPDSVLLEPLAQENPDTGVPEPATGFTIEARNITIDGLMIRGASTGISALGGSDGLRIRNCAILESKGDGIRVFESRDIGIENTISASNLYAGIKLRRSAEAELRNNLLYGNGEWGVSMDNTSASDDYIPPISDGNLLEANTIAYNAVGNLKLDNSAGIVRNNLLTDADGFGIKVETSEIILQHNGFWSPAGPAQAISPAEVLFCTECFGNIWADPLFLSPAGTDGTQGGSGWRDDDFRVRQIGAGQIEQSPAVDAGSDQALLLGLTGTTATSGIPDLGMVDLGYHYANGERALRAARWRAADTSAIVYVDAQIGDDQRTRSEAMDMNTPWASLRHALGQLVPGDTLILGAGVWNESMDIRVSDITILGSDSLGSTTIAPGDRRDAIRVRAARVEIRNLVIDGGRRGISLYRQAEDTHLEDLRIENVRSDGIALRATADTTIESTAITGCRRTGISATRATELSIQNVEITACRRGGISMSRSSGVVAFATIHEAGRTGISVRQSPDLEIRDSIITGHSGWGIHMRSRDGQEASLRHLLLGNNRMDLEPEDQENSSDILTNSNPLYLDPEGGDFSLSPESPAIDKGSDTAIALGVDHSSTQAGHGAPDTGMADLGVHR